MKDSAKTSYEREINRKLDALKVAIETLMTSSYIPYNLARERLQRAWKEEEEVHHG